MKIFDFCKIFPPKNQKETSVGQILSVLSDEISKWRNLSDYRTMRYLFFARTAFFRRGVFSHARVRACGHMRARTHLCNACAFIIGARRTKFQLSAFYNSFADLFHPASSQKAKLRNFRWKTVPKLAKSGKKREIRLETTEKRLFAAMKGRYSSERMVKRRKPAKKREKRKKIKKIKKF